MRDCIRLIGVLLIMAVLLPPCSAAGDTTKAVMLEMSMNNGVVSLVKEEVVYAYPPDNIAHNNILIRLADRNGNIILERGIDDPRIAYNEGGITYLDNVNFSVIVPFQRALAKVDLVNGTSKELLISVRTEEMVSTFCRDHSTDPDCGGSPAASTAPTKTPVSITTILLAAAAAGCAVVAVRRR